MTDSGWHWIIVDTVAGRERRHIVHPDHPECPECIATRARFSAARYDVGGVPFDPKPSEAPR